MNTTKITEAEIKGAAVASLPTRPTAGTPFGGGGYTAKELKAAFDRLPLIVAQRVNSLIDDCRNGKILEDIPTRISKDHTLTTLIEDIVNGNFATYLAVGSTTLAELFVAVESRLSSLEEGVALIQEQLSLSEETEVSANE